jgi:hypothetical protein
MGRQFPGTAPSPAQPELEVLLSPILHSEVATGGLDLVAAGLAVLILAIVVQLRASVNPGLVGLGHLNIMSFNVNLADLIKQWAGLELIGRYLEAERLRRIDGIRSQVSREPGTGNILAWGGCNFHQRLLCSLQRVFRPCIERHHTRHSSRRDAWHMRTGVEVVNPA